MVNDRGVGLARWRGGGRNVQTGGMGKLDVCIAFVRTAHCGKAKFMVEYPTSNGRMVMVKTANLYARIEPELKNAAETILGGLGVPVSNAINMFYRQIVLHRGLPFAVQFPAKHLPNAATLTDAELDAEVARGFDDIAAGRKRPLKEVAASLKQEFAL